MKIHPVSLGGGGGKASKNTCKQGESDPPPPRSGIPRRRSRGGGGGCANCRKLSQIARQICTKLRVICFMHQGKGARNCCNASQIRKLISHNSVQIPRFQCPFSEVLTRFTLKTLTSLNKEYMLFFLGDNSIWSFPSVSSLCDYSKWRS